MDGRAERLATVAFVLVTTLGGGAAYLTGRHTAASWCWLIGFVGFLVLLELDRAWSRTGGIARWMLVGGTATLAAAGVIVYLLEPVGAAWWLALAAGAPFAILVAGSPRGSGEENGSRAYD